MLADPKANDPVLLSMALRFRHDFGLLPDGERKSILTTMNQLREEVLNGVAPQPGTSKSSGALLVETLNQFSGMGKDMLILLLASALQNLVPKHAFKECGRWFVRDKQENEIEVSEYAPALDALEVERKMRETGIFEPEAVLLKAFLGQPVRWEREHPEKGWISVEPGDIQHYEAMGQRIRPLFAV